MVDLFESIGVSSSGEGKCDHIDPVSCQIEAWDPGNVEPQAGGEADELHDFIFLYVVFIVLTIGL